MRFEAIVLAGMLVSGGAAAAQTPAGKPVAPGPKDGFLGVTSYRLWDGDAPGARGTADADVPVLTHFRVHGGTGNGTAVIVAPGGAYLGLAANLEGRQVADWFAARGVTAFVLRYRLGRNYLYPTPLVDARRAVRLVRSRAKELGVASDRIGMMGFSAGGHLTAMAATTFEAGKPDAPDPVERVSSRPDFIVLGYPWLNAMTKDQQALSYCGALKIEAASCASFEQYSPDRHVTAQTPPAFIYHTTDDELVPVEASVSFYRRLAAAGVAAEMHLFQTGRHGSGLGLGDPALDAWPSLLEAWMRGRGLFTPDPVVVGERKRLLSPPEPRKPGAPFTVDLPLRDLLGSPDARKVLVRHLGEDYVLDLGTADPGFRFSALLLFDPDRVSAATLAAIEAELRTVPR